MNSTIIPAKILCSKCQNINTIDAEHCVGCGISFVFGKADAWKSEALVSKKVETKRTKPFQFMGTKSQAIKFHKSIKETYTLSSLAQDEKYDNVWYVYTENVDFVEYDILTALKHKIIGEVIE